MARFDLDTFDGQYVNALLPAQGRFDVYSREGLHLNGRTVIVASGRAPVRLAVPGERELLGRGVSYRATCDAAFFRGRPTAVVGPGEPAAVAALQLSELDSEVSLISEGPLRAPGSLLDKLASDTRVRMRTGWRVTRIVGEQEVSAIALQDDAGEEAMLAVDAVFIEVGSVPADEFTGGLVQVNEAGEIEVDRNLMTSQPGVFAAGDVTNALGKQVIIAAGDGARAGVAAARWLQRR